MQGWSASGWWCAGRKKARSGGRGAGWSGWDGWPAAVAGTLNRGPDLPVVELERVEPVAADALAALSQLRAPEG